MSLNKYTYPGFDTTVEYYLNQINTNNDTSINQPKSLAEQQETLVMPTAKPQINTILKSDLIHSTPLNPLKLTGLANTKSRHTIKEIAF